MMSANSGEAGAQRPAGVRRFQVAGVGIACLLGVLLMYAGQRGRHQVGVQSAVKDIISARDRLQRKLEGENANLTSSVGLQGQTTLLSALPESDANREEPVAALRNRLEQFSVDYSQNELSAPQSLEIRLSQATLNNAEERFADALALVTDRDEMSASPGVREEGGRLARVLLVRGDSYFGLQKWAEALTRYQRVLALQPRRSRAMARVAECQLALGKRSEGLATLQELAKSQSARGDALLVRGKIDAAIGRYNSAIEIHTRLIQELGQADSAGTLAVTQNKLGNALLLQGKPAEGLEHYQKALEIQNRASGDGRNEPSNDLALTYNNLGNALLAQEKPDLAMGQYRRAIEIRAALSERATRSDLSGDLALSHGNLGDALLAQGMPGPALEHYEQAIKILAPLIEQPSQGALANELALTYNNRGVIRCLQRKVDDGVADFDSAIKILSRLLEEPAQIGPGSWRTGAVPQIRVKLDVAFGFADKALDVVTRTRLIEDRGRIEAVAFATSLDNRGYASLQRGKLDSALLDFNRAAQTYATLVDQEGQRDLASRFAKSLSPLAWVYATTADNSFRNGARAKKYALRACELSGWSACTPIESLAAACAETGDFAGALKWQEKALELAPAGRKPQLRSRLEVYKTGNPYREPLAKAP